MFLCVYEISNCGFKGQFSLRPNLIFKVKQGEVKEKCVSDQIT